MLTPLKHYKSTNNLELFETRKRELSFIVGEIQVQFELNRETGQEGYFVPGGEFFKNRNAARRRATQQNEAVKRHRRTTTQRKQDEA